MERSKQTSGTLLVAFHEIGLTSVEMFNESQRGSSNGNGRPVLEASFNPAAARKPVFRRIYNLLAAVAFAIAAPPSSKTCRRIEAQDRFPER